MFLVFRDRQLRAHQLFDGLKIDNLRFKYF